MTKGKQWIRLNKDVELLDTPGILWPKFDDQMVGLRLALIGSIKDEILNIDELSLELISYLKENYAGTLAARYEVEETVERPVELLEAIAQKRGCVQRGNEIDYSKAAALVIDDFRSGRLGRITLEFTGGRIMEVRKIGEIKEELKATADTELSEFIRRYAADERAGVRTMLAQAQKRQEKV